MLSPSLSSNSLEQSTTISTSTIIAASESSTNSGLLISPTSEFNNINGGFSSISGSTPLIDHHSTFEDYNNHHHSVPYSSFHPSTSTINSDDKALYVVNPCYQSAIFQRQQQSSNNNLLTTSAYISNNENGQHHLQQQQKKALRSLQNIRPTKMPSHGLLPHHNIQQQPPRNLSTRRTISLQIVRPFPLYCDDDGSCSSSSLSSSKTTNLFETSNGKSEEHYIGNQSALIMDYLNEISLTELTKLFKEYSPNPSTHSPRWLIQIKHLQSFIHQIRTKSQNSTEGNKTKTTETVSLKHAADYNLYKIPLGQIQAESVDASPLPQFIHDIMQFIAEQADLAEGIFRKNGCQARIVEIKNFCSKLTPNQPIPSHLLNDSQLNDLADSLKRYFRELPECLFTNRLSKMLENVVVELPPECHFHALHLCVLLLPAENREALFILLKFLKGISRHSGTNQMCAQNLATCWMPSLFHFSTQAEQKMINGVGGGVGGTLGRKLIRRKTIGIPGEKERNAYEGIKRILAKMIEEWEQICKLPKQFVQRIVDKGLNDCHDLSVPLKNGKFEFTEELHLNFRRQLFRLKEDYFDHWKGWELKRVFSDGTLLFTSTKNDMIPLKCFRVQMTIAAPSNLILNTIHRSRNSYNPNVLECKRIGPSGQNFDIIRIEYAKTVDNPKCKYSFLTRRWTYSELDADSICSLIECSIIPRSMDRHSLSLNNNLISVFESKFLIHETCPGHSSQLNYISRIDLRGKPSQWYDRIYGEMLVNQMRRLKQCIYKIQFNSRGTIV